jgi:hypothetical protein
MNIHLCPLAFSEYRSIAYSAFECSCASFANGRCQVNEFPGVGGKKKVDLAHDTNHFDQLSPR